MPFYNLEKASIEETKKIIEKLDLENKKDYFYKAAVTNYVPNETFAVFVDYFKQDNYMLARAFSDLATQNPNSKEVNPKLHTLLKAGANVKEMASHALVNGACRMNAATAALLISQGADPCSEDNMALKWAIYEGNKGVINELIKHGNNKEVFESIDKISISTGMPQVVVAKKTNKSLP